MLPFVRMFEYGNIAPSASYKKIQSYNAGFMVLMSDGKLYSTGYDTYGHLGGTGNSLTKWKLLSSSCDYFWTSQYGTIYRTLDNKYMFSGTKRLLGELSGTQLTYIDITSKMSIVTYNSTTPENTNIQIGFDSMYYMNTTVNGNLYGMGSNQTYSLGLNNTTPVTSWTLIINTVRDYSASGCNASVVVNLTDNRYMAAGSASEVGVQRRTFSQLTPPASGQHKFFISKYAGHIVAQTNTIWGIGYNGVTLGIGTDASYANTPTALANSTTMSAKLPADKPCTYNSNYGTIIKLNDGLYGVGNNNPGFLTSVVPSGQITTFTKMAEPPMGHDNVKFIGVNSFTSYVADATSFYICGRLADIPGLADSANSGIWTAVPKIENNLL